MENSKAPEPRTSALIAAGLDLASDEALARVLDRGSIEEWRAVYHLLAGNTDASRQLQERIYQILLRVPTARPYVWVTVLTSLGYPIDWTATPRQADDSPSS